jgi:chromosome segregation ATPase
MKASMWLLVAAALHVASSFSAGLSDDPVERVVTLLGELKARIEKDGETEQASYDKYACWCEETTRKTAETITEVKDLLKSTGNTILKLKGSVATLTAEIKGLVVDIKENEDDQAKHTNIREKENAAFQAEKVEMEQAITALEKAITVLKAATGTSFMQTSKWTSAVSDVVATMSSASTRVKISPKQLALVKQLAGKGSSKYAPQSATIQGILSDMYTTFSQNLQTATADEATAHRNYENLMNVLQEALKTLQETLVKKQQEKTEDEVQLADAMQTYADKEEELAAEIKLFDAMKESCTEKTSVWSERSSLRTTELEGIAKAIEILSSDEAKETFGKARTGGDGTTFIQVHSHSFSVPAAQKASAMLRAHAQKSHSYRLAALAAEVRTKTGGHFDEVIATIDKLLVQLQEEEKADTKKVDSCKEEYQEITLKKNDLNWQIEKNDAKIQKHEKVIEETTAAKEITVTSISDATEKLTEIEKKRTEEHEVYEAAKTDDEKAVSLLEEAKEALKSYYASHPPSLMQHKQEPDFKVSEKDNAKVQTDGVISLIEHIIENLNTELAEAKAAEEAAQADYETLKGAIEDQKAKLEKTLTNQEDAIANEGAAKTDEEDLKTQNSEALTTEETTETDLKKTCDDAIKNQPERAKKRAIEADGLRQAKEFLAGMEADAFVQSSKHIASDFPTFQTLSFLQRKAY